MAVKPLNLIVIQPKPLPMVPGEEVVDDAAAQAEAKLARAAPRLLEAVQSLLFLDQAPEGIRELIKSEARALVAEVRLDGAAH